MVFRDPSKRIACDRCRKQKLRCPRKSDSHGPCDRCGRNGATCVTSDPKPLGRPSRSTINRSTIVSSRPLLRAEEMAQGLVLTTDQENALSGWTSPFFPSENETPSRPHSATNNSGNPRDIGQSPLFPISSLENYSSFGSRTTLSNWFFNLDQSTLQTSLLADGVSLSSQPMRPAGLGRDGEASTCNIETPMMASNEIDAIVGLASLNERLAQQIALFNLRPWNMLQHSIVCDGYDNPTDTTSNPLSNLVQTTIDFIAILQTSYSSTTGFDSLSTGQTTILPSLNAPDSEASLHIKSRLGNMSTILVTIACYLQIIQLYDYLFVRIYRSLVDVTDEQIALFQLPPGLQFYGGLPFSNGELRLKIVFQIIEHYLLLMDRLMGLPEEFRFSSRDCAMPGLLSNLEFSPLLHAAMGQTQSMEGESGGSRVRSLRETLKKVQQWLDARKMA